MSLHAKVPCVMLLKPLKELRVCFRTMRDEDKSINSGQFSGSGRWLQKGGAFAGEWGAGEGLGCEARTDYVSFKWSFVTT